MELISKDNPFDVRRGGIHVHELGIACKEEFNFLCSKLNEIITAINDNGELKTKLEKLAEEVNALTIPETSDTGEKGKVPVYADNRTIYGNITGKAQTATNAENASKIANVSVIIDGDLQDGDTLVYSAEKQGFIIKRFEEEPTGEGSDAP